MLVEIPEDFEEDFMQILIMQLFEAKLDAYNAKLDSFEWQDKYIKLKAEIDAKEKKTK